MDSDVDSATKVAPKNGDAIYGVATLVAGKIRSVQISVSTKYSPKSPGLKIFVKWNGDTLQIIALLRIYTQKEPAFICEVELPC